MLETAPIDAVMRTLADPTRRAVFERIVSSDEITVGELTRGSGVTQGAISQHLKSLKQAGLVAERPEGRNVYYRAEPMGLTPLVDWMRPLRRLLARALRQPPNPSERDRSMSTAALKSHTQDVVLDEVFPHAPGTVWKALTSGELMARWMMTPIGFEPVEGNHFMLPNVAGGAWDGTIHCQVLEVVENERFVYSWKGGHDDNVGYGSPLDTVVTWTLAARRGRHAPASRPFRLCAAPGTIPPQDDRRRLDQVHAQAKGRHGHAALS